MLHLQQILRERKRITTIAIAGAAAVVAVVSLAAFGLMSAPASLSAVNNAFSAASEGVSQAFAMLSETVNGAIASAQNLLGQQQ